MTILNLDEKTCPVCGKKFICMNLTGWTYRVKFRGVRYTLCSYTCMRKLEKEIEEKRYKRGKQSE